MMRRKEGYLGWVWIDRERDCCGRNGMIQRIYELRLVSILRWDARSEAEAEDWE